LNESRVNNIKKLDSYEQENTSSVKYFSQELPSSNKLHYGTHLHEQERNTSYQ